MSRPAQLASARAKLNLSPDQLVNLRTITPILKQAAGGVKACIEALRCDDSPDSISFIAKYDLLADADYKVIPLEEIAVAASLTPRRLVELVSGAMSEQGEEAAKLIVASAKPKIIAAMIREGSKAIGEKDRENFLKGKSVDWFIQPKGLSVNVDNRTQNNTLNAKGEERALPPPRTDDFLLDISSTLRPDHKQLEAPPQLVHATVPELEYVEADV